MFYEIKKPFPWLIKLLKLFEDTLITRRQKIWRQQITRRLLFGKLAISNIGTGNVKLRMMQIFNTL